MLRTYNAESYIIHVIVKKKKLRQLSTIVDLILLKILVVINFSIIEKYDFNRTLYY
jgi:hypothetical protein